MGQQQLFLLLIAFVFVGITISLGITLFNAHSVASTKETIIATNTALAAMAQEYYRKPVTLAGGGNSFEEFVILNSLKENALGTYEILEQSKTALVISGAPISEGDDYNWKVVTTVTANTISSEVKEAGSEG